jgi:fumarate reductase subunit C
MEIPTRLAGIVAAITLSLGLVFSLLSLTFQPAQWATVLGWVAQPLLLAALFAVYAVIGEFVYISLPLTWRPSTKNGVARIVALVLSCPILFGADWLFAKLAELHVLCP